MSRFKVLAGAGLLLAASSAAFAQTNTDQCFQQLKAGNLPAAIRTGKQAVQSFPVQAASHYCLGEAYRRSGELSLALQEMQRAEHHELAANRESLMNIHNRMGMILSKTEDGDSALREFVRYRALARELGKKDDEASALNNIAVIYYSRGAFNLALIYYEGALKLSPDESKNAATYGNIATVYLGKNNSEKAIEYQKKAISIDESNGDKHSLSVDLLNLGSIYRSAGSFNDASKYLFDGLDQVRKLNDAYWEGMASRYISKLYSDTGDMPKAQKWLKGAVDIFTRVGAVADAEQARVDLEALNHPKPQAREEGKAAGEDSTL